MSNLELEVKILNIDKKAFIEKLEKLGAKFVEDNMQILYTYDLNSIYGRYIDLVTLLNNKKSNITYEANMKRLELLFWEIDNLLTREEKEELKNIISLDNLVSIMEKEDSKILEYINNKELDIYISKFHNNGNKWIRVRRTNNKTTIAVKHVLAENETCLQQMMETEINVDSIEDANKLLNALGFAYKSNQEKHRTTYMYEGYEIDIDTWPGLPTYFELEGKSEEDIDNILNKLGYSIKDTVSCTSDDLYKKAGIDWQAKRELKFEDYK